MMKRILFLLLVVLGMGLSACSQPHEFSGTVFETEGPAFDFVGANYDGSTFRLSDHQGKVVLIFFGYTFCPDVCPLTLANFNTLYQRLGDQAEEVAMVLVTVDPERDTLEKLASYVPAFNKNFYGVRLEGAAYEELMKAYGVYVEKRFVEGADLPEGYFVDHTGIIYLVDKQGNLGEVFPPNSDADVMQADVEYWLAKRG
jgi:protein SCO1/2